MTTEERRALRRFLQSIGFQRVSFTQVDTEGNYSETFLNGLNAVRITWDIEGSRGE